MTAFTVKPIEPAVCDELRVRDDAGSKPELIVDAGGGNPLRCCLTLSAPGQGIVLASYAPLRRWAAAAGANPGPYVEVGPVFLHAVSCAGPTGTGYPPDYRGLPRVFRSYDRNGRILGGDVVTDGEDPEPVIEKVFADPVVAFIHARALVAGCFTFWIDKSPA